MAYGTTLLLAGADHRGVVLLQIGDGDILTVSEHGEVTRPLPADPRSVGNATASLAHATAWQDARTRSLPAEAEGPVLVLAATDGYANSFEDDAGFLQVGSDLLTMIRANGIKEVSGQLDGWLAEVSELGSGDADFFPLIRLANVDHQSAGGHQVGRFLRMGLRNSAE